MTKREKHRIESNCVTFDDDCYNETSNTETYKTMYDYETKVMKNLATKLYKSGESFIKDLERKIRAV
jgi:hypothetical protein